MAIVDVPDLIDGTHGDMAVRADDGCVGVLQNNCGDVVCVVVRSRRDADDLITALMLARDRLWPVEHPHLMGTARLVNVGRGKPMPYTFDDDDEQPTEAARSEA